MIPEHYRALKETAVLATLRQGHPIGVSGNDRAAFLQGLLTNDTQSLTPGTGCYSAWLTPQGRMLTDMHVFESGSMMLLDVPAEVGPATLQRLEQFLFSEDVQLADLAGTLTSVWIHGPASGEIIERVLQGAAGVHSWSEYQNARVQFGDLPAVVARVTQLGVPGFCIYLAPAVESDLRRALEGAGALVSDRSAIEAARIEAGYPLFGIDMTEDTIPLEAGIEQRAISFTKGCYVGQEVIIRVLHRGHGRVAKKLVMLRIDGAVPPLEARIFSDDRDVGSITSADHSPALGAIALGYVHRDFVAPGTIVAVDTPAGRVSATVS